MLFFEIWDGWFSTSLTWITSCKLSVGVFFLIDLEFLTLPFLRVLRRYCDSRVLGLLSFLFFSLDFTTRALLECCDFSDCFDLGDYRDLLVPDMLDRKDALELWLLSDAFGDLDLKAMSVFCRRSLLKTWVTFFSTLRSLLFCVAYISPLKSLCLWNLESKSYTF